MKPRSHQRSCVITNIIRVTPCTLLLEKERLKNGSGRGCGGIVFRESIVCWLLGKFLGRLVVETEVGWVVVFCLRLEVLVE